MRQRPLATVPAAAAQSRAELLVGRGTGAGGRLGGLQVHHLHATSILDQGTGSRGLEKNSGLIVSRLGPCHRVILTFLQQHEFGQARRTEQSERQRWRSWPISQSRVSVTSRPAATPTPAATHGHQASSSPPGGRSTTTYLLLHKLSHFM